MSGNSKSIFVGSLNISTIKPLGDGLFTATFYIGDSPKQTLTVRTKDLETFNAFRRAVTAKIPCWMTHDAEKGGKYGNQYWADEVRQAFDA